MEHLRLHDFAKALEANRQAFAHLPNLKVLYAPRLIRNLAASLMGLKRFEEAVTVLSDALEAYPDYTDLLFQKGLAQLEQRHFTEACETFRRCVEQGEPATHYVSDRGVGSFRAWFGLGYCLEQMGDYRGALEAYEKSLQACDIYPGPAYHLTCLLLKVEPPEAVLREAERVANTNDPLVLMALVAAFREAKRFQTALELLTKAIELHPQPALFTLKGEALLYLGRYQEAAATLTQALARGERSPSATSLAAVACLLGGDQEGAKGYLARAEADPSEAGRAKAFRCWSDLLQGKRPVLPRQLGPEGRQKFEEGVWAVYSLLLELGEFERFETALGLLDLLDLSEQARHLRLGKLYYTCGFIDSAIEELSQVDQEKVDAEAAEMLGNLCEQRGLQEEALAFYQAAVEREPENPKRHVLLVGKALSHGRWELAEEVVRQGLQRFPNHGALKQMLSWTRLDDPAGLSIEVRR